MAMTRSVGLRIQWVCSINIIALQYFGAAFKIPLISRWAIVITGPEMIEEVRMASDDELSFNEAISDVSSPFITLSKLVADEMLFRVYRRITPWSVTYTSILIMFVLYTYRSRGTLASASPICKMRSLQLLQTLSLRKTVWVWGFTFIFCCTLRACIDRMDQGSSIQHWETACFQDH